MIQTLEQTEETTARRILDIQIPAYQVEAALIGFEEIPPLRDTVASIKACKETFLGYFLDDELVGFISYTMDTEAVEICRLVVHPSHFRKGIAKKLLKYLLSAVSAGKKTVVSTGAKNAPAKELYLSAGFTEVKEMEVASGVAITLLARFC